MPAPSRRWLTSLVWGSESSTVPIMLDIEYNPYGAECYGLSATAMVSWISAFDAEIQAQTGRLPVIYAPPGWWSDCTGGSTGQQWRVSAAGGGSQMVNPASGLCLSDPGDATGSGTAAVVASCASGDPGQVWRVR